MLNAAASSAVYTVYFGCDFSQCTRYTNPWVSYFEHSSVKCIWENYNSLQYDK